MEINLSKIECNDAIVMCLLIGIGHVVSLVANYSVKERVGLSLTPIFYLRKYVER